jgi:hypothetical protein
MDPGMPPSGWFAGLMLAYEHSALGQAARGTTWLYPLANLVHVLGAALLVGAIAAFDIQVLRRAGEIKAVARATLPIAAAGLVLQLASGLVLLSAEASTLVRNPAFQFKMVVLMLGLVNLTVFHWRFGQTLHGDVPHGAHALAGISLASWILVLLAGRAIAYL